MNESGWYFVFQGFIILLLFLIFCLLIFAFVDTVLEFRLSRFAGRIRAVIAHKLFHWSSYPMTWKTRGGDLRTAWVCCTCGKKERIRPVTEDQCEKGWTNL